MRTIVIFITCLFGVILLRGQDDIANDTTIYKVTEELPRFPACEALDTILQVKEKCAQQQLLSFVYQNVQYPLEARQNGDEGTVVVQFVVEKDSTVTQPKIIKDIGGGCGVEVLRVINGMIDLDIKWVPGKMKGKLVRSSVTLPVRFRLEEAPPYSLIEGDTVYTKFDEGPSFKEGDEALLAHLQEELDYPEAWKDTCLIGNIDVQLLIQPDGVVRVLNVTDYSNLGVDFYYEAIDVATSTFGKWNPAVYEGRMVPTTYDITLFFEPTASFCETAITDFQKATDLANDGAGLFNEGQQEEGIAKISEAINMFPGNSTFLYLRGQAYFDMNRFEEACTDLTKARDIAPVGFYDSVMQLICRK